MGKFDTLFRFMELTVCSVFAAAYLIKYRDFDIQ